MRPRFLLVVQPHGGRDRAPPAVSLAYPGPFFFPRALAHKPQRHPKNTRLAPSLGSWARCRDGEFGCCFGSATTGAPAVYSARPGARVWIGDPSCGRIRATMNLKQQFDRPSTPIVCFDGPSAKPEASEGPVGYVSRRRIMHRSIHNVSERTSAQVTTALPLNLCPIPPFLLLASSFPFSACVRDLGPNLHGRPVLVEGTTFPS